MRAKRSDSMRAVLDVTASLVLTLALSFALIVRVGAEQRVGMAALTVALGVALVAAGPVLRRTPVFTTPADRVTLLRISLIGVCAAHVTLWVFGTVPAQSWLLFAAAAPAIALDAVDGWVARRTHSSTPEGSRLDMESDAILYLILSLPLGVAIGWWVWLIGAMRYLFAAGSWLRPSWRRTLEYSGVRRVIAAVQGVVLAAFAGPWFSASIEVSVSAAACVLLLYSFGRDIVTLERQGAGSRRRRLP